MLGILAVMSGPVMAVRRELIPDMDDSVGDDCLIPLEVVSKGYLVRHCREAVAFDVMDSDPSQEFKTRVRMTQRNWRGTWSYPKLLSPFHNYRSAFSLWSHKVCRWMSPFFIIGWVGPCIVALIINKGFINLNIIELIVCASAIVFLALIFLSYLSQKMRSNLPILGQIWVCDCKLGFLMEFFKFLRGQRTKAYR